MPYLRAKAIDQNPALCHTSRPPSRLDIDRCILKVCSCSVHASWELKLSFSELLSQILSSKFREFCAVGEYIEAFEDTFEGSR